MTPEAAIPEELLPEEAIQAGAISTGAGQPPGWSYFDNRVLDAPPPLPAPTVCALCEGSLLAESTRCASCGYPVNVGNGRPNPFSKASAFGLFGGLAVVYGATVAMIALQR